MFFGAFAFSCSAGQVAQPFSTLRPSFHLHTHPECPELNLAVHWTRHTWRAVPAPGTWESYIVIVYNTAGHLIILLEGSIRTQLHPLTALILRHIGTWGIPTLMLNQKSFLDVIFLLFEIAHSSHAFPLTSQWVCARFAYVNYIRSCCYFSPPPLAPTVR